MAVELCYRCGKNPRRGRNYCLECGRAYHKERYAKIKEQSKIKADDDKSDKLFFDLLSRAKTRLMYENRKMPKIRSV